jgi:hypothetical protein
MVATRMSTSGNLAPGATGLFGIISHANNIYITANAYITISDSSLSTAYFQVLDIDPYYNQIIIQNKGTETARWSPNAEVALVGPLGPTGQKGSTGPTLFTTNGSNISYTDGTTTLSRLTVQTTDYNRLPMGILNQTQIGPSDSNYTVASGTTFPTNNSGNLIGSVTFNTRGPTGQRKIRTHINLNVEDNSQSTANNLYLTLYDGSTAVNRFRKSYRNGSYSNSINFYHYTTIDADTSKTYSLYGSSSSASIAISGNAGTYDSTTTAPPSFITIEDVGNL